MIFVLKVTALFSNIICCSLILSLVRLFFYFSPKRKTQVTAFIVHIFGKFFTFILRIKVIVSGEKNLLKEKGNFFVCNHLSYIDGIVATSLSPLVFVAKADVQNWPFFGLFTFLSDTIFVNRTNPSKIKDEIAKISTYLQNKVNVIIFPEGTSTNGDKLLPFKSSFFAAPQVSKSKIVPLVFTYKKIADKPIDKHNRDLVYWYDSMKFFPHLLEVLKLKTITLEVKVCEAIEFNKQVDRNDPIDRKTLSDTCWSVIDRHLNTRVEISI
tara:strand:- start:2236 stop:3039 length:804 start_codon:yes stop_codon:yes gene_type:complete